MINAVLKIFLLYVFQAFFLGNFMIFSNNTEKSISNLISWKYNFNYKMVYKTLSSFKYFDPNIVQ